MNELLYQALETEMGGVKVYRTAVRCAQNHEKILRGVFGTLAVARRDAEVVSGSSHVPSRSVRGCRARRGRRS